MADGKVKIDIVGDDSDIQKKIDDTEESLGGLGDKQKETQKETEKTKTKFEELAETIDKQEKELKDLKGEYIETAINLGENSKEAQALKEKFSSLNAELKENKSKFESVSDSLEDLGDNSEKSGKGFNLLDGVISTFVGTSLNDLAGKLLEVVGNLVALADETREYREDMAKLDTAFKSAGHSTETAQKAYDDFYKILGESDRSVEAVNHLAELTKSTEDVAKWSNIAAGVTAKFGDSLPIEGLTEAANETAKVGQVTGPLADALNWAGISEDKFNEQLKKCNSEQERATLITNTLSKEYETAAAEYNTLTASTQAAREATNRMEQAQAALGATMEPLTTAWTNLKASVLEWVAESFSAKYSTDVLTESQRASVTAAHEAAAAYRETKNAAHELALAQMSDVDYATNYLLPQLQELVDANGRVKQGYEERAAFILGQMNEAWGTEYTRVSEIIGKNGELKQSVLDVIEAKKAQILLAAHEEEYKIAVQNVAEAEKIRAQQATYLVEQSAKVANAEQTLIDLQNEVAEAVKTKGGDAARAYADRIKAATSSVDSEKAKLQELQEEYKTSEENLFTYYEDINAYQTASTLLMEGKTAEAVSYLNDLSAGYDTTAGNVQGSIEEQRKALEQQVIDTEVNAQLMKEAYKSGVKGVSEEMVKTAEAQAATAKEKFLEVGGDITKGIAQGAEGKEVVWTLNNAMARVVNGAIEAAKKAGIIKSPSRKMRDEVGKMLDAGMAVGVDEWADKPVEAVADIFVSMGKVIKEAQKDTVDIVKDYNAEMAELEKEKNKSLADLETKFIEDKKKKGADRKALEKKYNEDIENLNKQHADKLASIQDNIQKTITGKMQEMVTLEEKYKSDVVKVWEDLDKSITDVLANYDNQLKSRTESIASSLNLWNEASKNSVSGAVLQKNLQSQVRTLEDYNKAIAKLEERNISEAFLNHIKQMGVGSTGEIEALVKMSEAQLSSYVELWEKKNELARNAAVEELEPLKAETEAKIEELTNAVLDKYAELRAEYTTQGTLLLTELKQAMIEAGQGGYEEIIAQIDDYTSAGEDLMNGVVAGIVDKSPALVDAVTRAVNRAIRAAKDAAGIESPSKVMKKEVGANLAEGVKVGWAEKVDTIKNKMATDMQGITARIKTAVSLEQARMSQGVGVRDTGFSEVAQAVGMQTAGINSLASEYRRGSNTQVTVPLILDGRELGRAIVDLGNAETVRTGTSLSFA